ncbi:MAG: carbamoyl-phosphate synthase large subunit, partial [Ruminiclostridium sp.]|nr:carbamoyl-phosphate synthase large subunit [Ruminiclostridium sp.]
MKAVRSLELGMDPMTKPAFTKLSDEEVEQKLHDVDVDRSFCVFEALKRGISVDRIHKITMIDRWFISKLKNLVELEKWLLDGKLTQEKYNTAKKYCYLDKTIETISGQRLDDCGIQKKTAVYKMVDTCAAEFSADTPYFYSTFDEENEAAEFIEQHPTDKKKIIVFGSGPIRIGQGIEFDYCSVHCVWALKEMGYEAIICNNNPETVSTDFDTGDRLYFDPLTFEDVDALLATEKPYGVVVQFGGQTAIKLTKHLQEVGARILGTSAESIDAAEDRELFDELLERCGIPRPAGETVFTTEEAVKIAEKLGYPVLLRPSYVLGGQNMIIAHCDSDVVEYMDIITQTKLENPVLIDKYLMGTEVEVDAICDGTDFVIPGIMEHIERAGVHSGDSISVYPAQTLSERTRRTIISYTERLAKALNVIGLVNIQYVVYNGEVYVIEVNPRSSRTVPYISKVTGVQMVDVATKIMLGHSLKEQGFESGLYPEGDYVAVKVPVFSFEKLHDVDTQLGPEMKSTGECLGIARTFHEAIYKGLIAAGFKMFDKGGVLISVRNEDKPEIIELASRFEKLGFEIYATSGTASTLNRNMVATNFTYRVNEGQEPNIISLLESGKINYVISTSETGRKPARESVKLRRKSVERSIACLTSVDTANALVSCLEMNESIDGVEMVDITTI